MRTFLNFLKKLTPIQSRKGTVRFMFPAFLSFVALMSAAVFSSTNSSHIRLSSPLTTVEAGDRLAIEVFAYAHVPVNAVDVTLQFDAQAFDVIGVDKGQSVITIWTSEPIIQENKVILRGGTFRKGFVGEHKIATINLRAKETGPATVSTADVVLLAGDGKGTKVSVTEATDSTLNVYVYDENTDPENIKISVSYNILTDIDGDGKVTLRDISVFMGAWSDKSKLFDFNNDGSMTFKDFSILLANVFLN